MREYLFSRRDDEQPRKEPMPGRQLLLNLRTRRDFYCYTAGVLAVSDLNSAAILEHILDAWKTVSSWHEAIGTPREPAEREIDEEVVRRLRILAANNSAILRTNGASRLRTIVRGVLAGEAVACKHEQTEPADAGAVRCVECGAFWRPRT